jgi:oxygen-independent coproporphyrinogen III oxidase
MPGMDTLPFAKAMARPVPRYTSYPPATHFSPAVGPADFAGWLAAIPSDTALSLYVHVPYCVKLCWYCACHTRVANRYDSIERYRDGLLREIAGVRAAIGGRRKVAHLHWGGGTPTVLNPEDLARIDGALKDAFTFDPKTDIAVEIDPRSLSDDMVRTLADAAVTRVSFGVQDFDPKVQAAINREQSFAVTQSAVERLRAAGIRSVNLDLVYGLPLQTERGLRRTIAQTLSLAPDRVALFGYAHVPWMKPNQKLIREQDLPGTAERWAQARAAADLLRDAGYVAIGIDHFALPSDSLAQAAATGHLRRNFQGYTTDGAEHLVGFGASAISALPQGYAQNVADTANWLSLVETGRLPVARGIALGDDDRLRRDVIERLMCDLMVDLDAAARHHGRSTSAFADALPALGSLAREGIVDFDGWIVRVTPEARPLARLAAAAFDSWLAAGHGRHSVAV